MPRMFYLVETPVGDGTSIQTNKNLEFLKSNHYILGYDKIERNTAFNGNFPLNFTGGKEFIIKEKNTLGINLRVFMVGSNRYIPFHSKQITENHYIQIKEWYKAYEKRRENYTIS